MSIPQYSDAPSRSQRLKLATRAVHEQLDHALMSSEIFSSRVQFAKFLRVQYRFHRDADGFYDHPLLLAQLPSLKERRRLAMLANDLSALEYPLPLPARIHMDMSLPTALGWLYVAEGSRLGGTLLYKMAVERLGLDKHHGASHLAPHPDGAAKHWREFTGVLDAATLSTQEEQNLMDAARDAFSTVSAYAREEFA